MDLRYASFQCQQTNTLDAYVQKLAFILRLNHSPKFWLDTPR